MGETSQPAQWGSARQRLLDAASDILRERFSQADGDAGALRAAFGFLEPSKLADRAGVAASSFTYHWGKPDHEGDDRSAIDRFLSDLFQQVWGQEFGDDTLDLFSSLEHRGIVDFADAIRFLIDAEFSRYDVGSGRRPGWAISIAIALHGGADEAVSGVIVQATADMYRVLLERYGREVREPFSFDHIVVSLAALFDGLWMRETYGGAEANPMIEFPHPTTGVIEPWSLVSILSWQTVATMSKPLDKTVSS